MKIVVRIKVRPYTKIKLKGEEDGDGGNLCGWKSSKKKNTLF